MMNHKIKKNLTQARQTDIRASARLSESPKNFFGFLTDWGGNRGRYFTGFLFLFAAFIGHAQAQTVSINSVSISPNCGTAGINVKVIINYCTSNTGSFDFNIGFGDANALSGGNVYWYGNGSQATCGSFGTSAYYTAASTSSCASSKSVTTTVAVPNVAYITNIYVIARNSSNGYGAPHCDGSGSQTDNWSSAFNVPCGNTYTPTATATKTYTNTATPSRTNTGTSTPVVTPTRTSTPTNTFTPGAANTNTFTNTPTSTFTLTPTKTFTSTRTNTPTLTFTPTNTQVPCQTPHGAVNGINLQGGVYCYNPPIHMLSAGSVFGMSLGDLQNIADYVGDSGGTSLIISGDWKLSYFNGNLTYGPTQPYPYKTLGILNSDGSYSTAYGVLVVHGDLTLQANSYSHFGGVVFVTGNVDVEATDEIDGALILGSPYTHNGNPGTLIIGGTSGSYAQIIYNPSLVANCQLLVAKYKEDVADRKVLLAVPNL